MDKEPKRGPGRPRQLEDRQRVVAFVSGRQYEILRRFAEANGQTISETVRGFIEDAESVLAWSEKQSPRRRRSRRKP